MAEGGWSSGTWGESGWGMSVYDRTSSDTATATENQFVAGSVFNGDFVDTATGTDAISASFIFQTSFVDTATGTDAVSSLAVFNSTLVAELQLQLF